MTGEGLRLSVYFGESDRVGRHLLSDALLDVFEQRSLHASMLLRAVEGFGANHALRTDRFLTLSEDLPLVATAVDRREAIEAALPDVNGLVDGGLITLERVRLGADGARPGGASKLTVQLGRDERFNGGPAYAAVVEHLRRHGFSGAAVLLGVDGTAHGVRRRARFLSRNASVPAAVVGIGPDEAAVEAVSGLAALADDPIVVIENVTVCKRDGVLLTAPPSAPAADLWQKLTVFGRAEQLGLVRELRAAGAAGATTLRGVWGYSGDHAPHGDRLFRLRRDVPIVTTVIDRPDAAQRLFSVIDGRTSKRGLVTSELVPSFRAVVADA